MAMPSVLVDLDFASGPFRVWTGIGPLEWAGMSFEGVGSIGAVGAERVGELTLSGRFPGAFETVEQVGTISRIAAGRAERPFAPVNIAGSRDGSQNLTITWVRRRRIGGEWLDLTGDVPLGEGSEAYEVEIRNAGDTATLRTITGVSLPSASYTAAQQTTDFGATQPSVNLRIFQVSATVGRGIAGRATV